MPVIGFLVSAGIGACLGVALMAIFIGGQQED